MTRSATQYGDFGRIDTRLRISALWIAVLLIFAYVDLFSLYCPDFRAILLALVIHHAWTWPQVGAAAAG
jgi:hypothetical protein